MDPAAAARCRRSTVRQRGRDADRPVAPRRFRATLRALRRRSWRAPRTARDAWTAGIGRRGPDRRVPRPGAVLRARACAVAAGLPALAGRRRDRGQARFRRAPARRSPHHDRTRRQGAGGADRLPARHDAASRPADRHAVDRCRSAAAVASAQGIQHRLLRRRATHAAPARAAGIPPAALCRADPGARPALCLRLAERPGRKRGANLAYALWGRLDGIGATFRV